MRRYRNPYADKRKHKRLQKKRHAIRNYSWNPSMVEAYYRGESNSYPWWARHHQRNGGYEYWQECYLSGRRRYAKNCTNRVIRARFRDMLRAADMDEDDIPAYRGSDYEKEFDYNWTIW